MTKSSEHRATFGCTLPNELLERIDRERGMAPRTRYVEHLIRKALDKKERGKAAKSPANEKV